MYTKNKAVIILIAVLLFQMVIANFVYAADGAGDEYKNSDLNEQFKKKPVSKTVESDIYYSDIDDESLKNIVSFLGEINIMKGVSDTEFGVNKMITRGEFLKCVLDAVKINSDSYKDSLNGTFYDLSKDDEMYSVVAAAVANNIAYGLDDNTFGVDKPITYNQAIAMILRVMGYDWLVKARGGSADEYYSIALDCKLLLGLNFQSTKELTRDEAAKLVYNGIRAPILKTKSYTSEDNAVTVNDNDITILSEYHDIYFEQGIVESNTITSIGKNSKSDDGMWINSVFYKTEQGAFNSLLGYKVDFYYHVSEDEEAKIVYMWTNKNVEEIKINADDFISYSNQILTYSDGNKSSEAEVDDLYTAVYNGELQKPKNLSDLLSAGDGNIILVSNDGDGVFENVFINKYESIILSSAVPSDSSITFAPKFNYDNIKIELDNTVLDIEDANGQKIHYLAEIANSADKNGKAQTTIDVSKIPLDSVVSFFASSYTNQREHSFPDENSAYIKAVVSTQKAKGIVEEINPTDNTITISNEKSSVTLKVSDSNYFDETGYGYKVGDKGTFYIDAFNKIAAFNPDENVSALQYGYLIKASQGSKLSDDMQAKILTYDGVVKTFTVGKKVKLNGDVINSSKLLAELGKSADMIKSGFKISQLIKYTSSTDNSIKEIETVLTSLGTASGAAEEHLRRDALPASYKSTDGYGSYRIRSQANPLPSTFFDYHKPIKYFTVPDSETFDEDDYYTDRDPKFDVDYITLEIYDVNKTLIPSVAVEYSVASSTEVKVKTSQSRALPVMIKKVYAALDKENNSVSVALIVNGSAEVKYYGETLNTFDGCKAGDMVYLYTKKPTKNTISKYEFVKFNGKKISPDSLADVNQWATGSDLLNAFGEVYYVSGNDFVMQAGPIVNADTGKRSIQVTGNFNTTVTWQFGGAIVYDGQYEKEPMVRVANIDDFKSVYKYGASKASKVYWYANDGGARQYVVYNNVN